MKGMSLEERIGGNQSFHLIASSPDASFPSKFLQPD